jgi:two-component system OmpR family sensor kinase
MRRLLPTSLTARVATAVVLLMATVSILISGLTTAAISSYLTKQLDDKVAASQGRAIGALNNSGPKPPEIQNAHGQDAGTVTAYLTASGASGNVITSDGDIANLTAQVISVLSTVSANGANSTVDLTGLGQYRVHASQIGDTTVLTGLPTKDIDNTVTSLVGWEVLFGGFGVVAAGGVAVFVVRRQMRPLRQVALTAREVAAIPLATGEIGVTARVPDELTDGRTEVGQVALGLNTLLGHMERALDARHRSELQVRQFVADASHELRTPLTTIHGYAQLSLRNPEHLPQAMGKVMVEATRMASLVEDLLLLARLDAGRPLDLRPVDLTRLAMDSVTDARIVGPDHHWALNLPDLPVVVTADEQRLHQVVTNLLSNARRHTPAGTTVTVGLTTDDRHSAVLTIHDNGPGIPPDLQPTVFKRLTRADTSRTRDSGGSGLGLSLAQSITEAHGGAVSVRSRPGDTCFIVALPRAMTGPPAHHN